MGWKNVALANKNARILLAILTKDVRFNANHVSVKPEVPNPVWLAPSRARIAIERMKSPKGAQSKMHRQSDRWEILIDV